MTRLASLLVSSSILLLTAASREGLSTSSSPPTVAVPFKDGATVSFEGTEITGREGEEVDAFFGIPYGEEPERWKAPVMKQWNETEGSMTTPTDNMTVNVSDPNVSTCLQIPLSSLRRPGNAPSLMGGNDCLKLNVWKPTNATSSSNLPVMVYIPGGGFAFDTIATTTEDGVPYQGQNLVDNTIVVTVQYRVGPLGWLAGDALRNRTADNSTGNYGFLDQRLALKWIHENIHAFGGDPARVFLFGESAGALSVSSHLVSEESWPYFSSAGLESGALPGYLPQARGWGEEQYQNFLQSLNCTTVDCLLRLSDEDIILKGNFGGGGQPILDGVVLRHNIYDALKTSAVADVPIIMGNTLTDQTQVTGSAVLPGVLSAGMTEEDLEKMQCGLGENFRKNVSVLNTRTKEGNITTSISEAFAPSNVPEATPPLTTNDEVTPAYWKGIFIGTAMMWLCPSLTAAELLSPRMPIYVYDFRAQPNVSYPVNGIRVKEGDDLVSIQGSAGVGHGSELTSVFSSQRNVEESIVSNANSTGYMQVTFDEEEVITPEQVSTLAKTMSQAWINFAKTHVPGFGWKPWTQEDPNRAIFDYNTRADAVQNEKADWMMMQCAVLNEVNTCGEDFFVR